MTDSRSKPNLAGWAGLQHRYERLYRDLHAHPELARREHRTAGLVAKTLTSLGFEVHERIAGTGVVGVLRNGGGPTVLMRSELDGLPIREQTGLPWASHAEGADDSGTSVPVMHACGHDLHIASLLGAMDLLARSTTTWRGTAVAVFQPAEETGEGAAAMVADGLVDRVGEVDVALAQHVMALPSGRVYLRAGAAMSAARALSVTVHGRGAHGATPHAGIDAVVLVAMIVVRLQAVVAREIRPGDFAVLTVGALHAGSTPNTIPDSATLELSLRSYTKAGLEAITTAVRRVVEAECIASGSPHPPEFRTRAEFPPTCNSHEATARIRKAMSADLNGIQVVDLAPQAASDDFANLADAFDAPYCYWGVGGSDPEAFAPPDPDGYANALTEVPTNHSPFFAPDPAAVLPVGVQAMTSAALTWLAIEDRTDKENVQKG